MLLQCWAMRLQHLEFFLNRKGRLVVMAIFRLCNVLFVLLTLLTFCLAKAQEATLAVYDDAPAVYTVKAGDTLWQIAERYLEKPWQWERLLAHNPNIKAAAKIYPGDQLILRRGLQGQQTLSIEPPRPRIRRSNPSPAITTMNLAPLHQMLDHSTVVAKQTFDRFPLVTGVEEDHLVARPGFRIYVLQLAKSKHRDYTVLKANKVLRDPEHKKILGYLVTIAGRVRADNLHRVPASFKVVQTEQEITTGDRLIPSVKLKLPRVLHLRPPKNIVRGKIINVLNGFHSYGRDDLVVINLGRKQGLRAGDVLAIYGKERIKALKKKHQWHSKGLQIPGEFNGELIVFKTFAEVSFGLVMHTEREARLMDTVTNPI